MMGDFNDAYGKFISKSIQLDKNTILGLPNFNIPKTCCYEEQEGLTTRAKYKGDYIIVSENLEPYVTYYGIPNKYRRHRPLMSDHDPVMLVLSL